MFGFGKKTFDVEMAEFDKKAKQLGSALLMAMQTFDLTSQQALLIELNEVSKLRMDCCQRHGRMQEYDKWAEALLDGTKLIG